MCVGFVAGRVALGHTFFRVLRFSSVSIISPLLHINSVSSGGWTVDPPVTAVPKKRSLTYHNSNNNLSRLSILYRIRLSLQELATGRMLNQMNAVHILITNLRPSLILPTHLCLGLASDLFPSYFPTKILNAFLIVTVEWLVHPCLVFWKSLVQISVRIPAILTEDFVALLSHYRQMSRYHNTLCHGRFFSYHFQFIIHE
jgi:hypothetical protein